MAPPRVLTERDEQALVNEYRNGATWADLTAKYGASRRVIQLALQRAHVPMRRKQAVQKYLERGMQARHQEMEVQMKRMRKWLSTLTAENQRLKAENAQLRAKLGLEAPD